MEKHPQKKQISLKEASEIYSIPIWTLRAYVQKRLIPFRKIGRRVYLTEKFEDWLSQKDVDPHK